MSVNSKPTSYILPHPIPNQSNHIYHYAKSLSIAYSRLLQNLSPYLSYPLAGPYIATVHTTTLANFSLFNIIVEATYPNQQYHCTKCHSKELPYSFPHAPIKYHLLQTSPSSQPSHVTQTLF